MGGQKNLEGGQLRFFPLEKTLGLSNKCCGLLCHQYIIMSDIQISETSYNALNKSFLLHFLIKLVRYKLH